MNNTQHDQVTAYLHSFRKVKLFTVAMIARKIGNGPSNNRKHYRWDRLQVLLKKTQMFNANTLGQRNIFIRPNQHNNIMIDDIKDGPKYREAMSYDPCLVVETSKGNYQFHYMLKRKISEEKALNAQRYLTRVLNADKDAIGLRQLHRLPGYYNRKEGRGQFMCVVKRGGYRAGQMARLPKDAYRSQVVERGAPPRAPTSNSSPASQSSHGSRAPLTDEQERESRYDFAQAMELMERTAGLGTQSEFVAGVESRYPNNQQTWSNLREYAKRTHQRAKEQYRKRS
jgi:hypothetical protein